jgi:hypothetical protein
MNLLLSISTVPPRFQDILPEVLDSLREVECKKIVLIPKRYLKWGVPKIPSSIIERQDIEVVMPKLDYGPATKLLGAIEYARLHNQFTHILTLDDDAYYTRPLDLIKRFKDIAALRANEVLTIGGIKIVSHPYAYRNGLMIHNHGHVDLVTGCDGVLYPLSLIDNDLLFSGFDDLPKGIFNDDDLYFGIVLSRLKIPVFSFATTKEIRKQNPIKHVWQNSFSAVQFGVDLSRVTNQMQIIQYAVHQGWLPNPYSRISFSDKLAVKVDRVYATAGIEAGLSRFIQFAKRLYGLLQ